MTFENSNPQPGSTVWDVVIVGAGIVGAALARWLSRVDLRVAVVEKAWDVGMGASSRNSGVLHSGINYAPGSLRARLCMEGREQFQTWCKELGVPVRVPGKLVIAQKKQDLSGLETLHAQGEENGVPGLRCLSPTDVEELQPGIRALGGLHVPSSAIVPPYAATIAFAEDACLNGVQFFLGCEVRKIERHRSAFWLRTSLGNLQARWVINVAGLKSDVIGQALDPSVPTLYPCRGEYIVLDKVVGEEMKMLVYPVPPARSGGLGIHVAPTEEGNVLVGPSAEYITDRKDYECTRAVTDQLLLEASRYWPGLPRERIIGSYAGIRAKLNPPEIGGFADFFIEESSRCPRLINLVGLESPALTAAPAIARYVVEEIMGSRETLEDKPKNLLRPYRWQKRFDDLPEAEKERLVRAHPGYGEIVCRCEGVTRYEVLQAARNVLGVKTLAGLKYRTRVMMGRCGGAYCLPRIVRLLQEQYGWNPRQFYLKNGRSPLFVGWVKEQDGG